MYLDLNKATEVSASVPFLLVIYNQMQSPDSVIDKISDEVGIEISDFGHIDLCLQAKGISFAELLLQSTIVDIDFKDLTSRYTYRAYTKHFKVLTDAKIILKVNPINAKCHKYYVNPMYLNKFNDSYEPQEYSQHSEYERNYNHLWL